MPRLALKICLMILTAVFHREMLNKAVTAIIALMYFGEPSEASLLTGTVRLHQTDFGSPRSCFTFYPNRDDTEG